MPIITVHGLPQGIQALHTFRESLQRATANIPELRLTTDQVTVFFAADLLLPAQHMEVVTLVTGLLDRPERTPQVRQALADALLHETRVFLNAQYPPGSCRLIEALILPPFREEYGFARATPK